MELKNGSRLCVCVLHEFALSPNPITTSTTVPSVSLRRFLGHENSLKNLVFCIINISFIFVVIKLVNICIDYLDIQLHNTLFKFSYIASFILIF